MSGHWKRVEELLLQHVPSLDQRRGAFGPYHAARIAEALRAAVAEEISILQAAVTEQIRTEVREHAEDAPHLYPDGSQW